jgi:iron complex outermembrane recepter protein
MIRRWFRRYSIVGAAGVLMSSPVAADVRSLDGHPAAGERVATTSVPEEQAGGVVGTVVDIETGEPLAGTHVRLRELGRDDISRRDGAFRFDRLAPRTYTITAQRIGYAPVEHRVVVSGDTVRVTLRMAPSALELAGVVVTGTGRERGVRDTYRPTAVLSATELQRRLASSVPATLEAVPGFAAQYNGPGATRPVIRGLGGDRVLVLEDGQRTGDLNQTASDHGVMVEPLTARRIEVVRGPAGLLYGGNALGGVVNVIREDVPQSIPSRATGSVSSQLESVTRGGAAGAVVTVPAGPVALRAEISGRELGTTQTPLGPLPRTGMRVFNAAGGASISGPWGYVGGALRHYENVYGVPGEFNGELIPGGHPGGVEIGARRTSGRVQARLLPARSVPIDRVEVEAGATLYLHDEIEAVLDGRPVPGARFDQLSGAARVMAHHAHENGGFRREGAFGVAFDGRDLRAGGASPGTRSGEEWAVGLFAYEEFAFGPARLEAGLRYDHRRAAPVNRDSLRIRTDERRIVKPVSERRFDAVSGSLSALWKVRRGWTAGVGLSRSFRAPVIEELFSEGPHLADFSFDIGDPALEPEVGHGFELFVRGSRRNVDLEATTFLNRIRRFIQYVPTGETVVVIREGARPRTTPVFEARGDDAGFLGAEGRVQWAPLARIALDATASYTRATRLADGDPLPFIPPLSGRLEGRYEIGPAWTSVGVRAAAAQRRVPRPVQVRDAEALPQEPTAGYTLFNAGAGWRRHAGQLTHTLTLEAHNLTNRVWHDHLSRIKEIAPQPGRNVQLTYRVQF